MGRPVVLRRRLPGLTQQPMQRNHVRDHKQRHVQDRNGIGSAQLSCNRWKVGVDGVVIVDQGVCKCCWCFFWAVMAAREREDQRIVTL